MNEMNQEGSKDRGHRQSKVGLVVSTAMDKTAVIRVTRMVPHSLYVKTIKRSKKFMAHDEKNECRIGDKVQIVETCPLSKCKKWKVRKILERPA